MGAQVQLVEGKICECRGSGGCSRKRVLCGHSEHLSKNTDQGLCKFTTGYYILLESPSVLIQGFSC